MRPRPSLTRIWLDWDTYWLTTVEAHLEVDFITPRPDMTVADLVAHWMALYRDMTKLALMARSAAQRERTFTRLAERERVMVGLMQRVDAQLERAAMPKLSKQEIKRRERELMDFHRAQQRRVEREMFPSALPGSRGAVSPLGGVAVAKPPARKR